MIFTETKLSGAFLIKPEPFVDERGLFARVYCKDEFTKINFHDEFVQFNHSVNKIKGTFRGFHYQLPPFSEVKLIRCVRGKVFDVIVDIRKNSKTFLKHFSVELSEENMKMLLIPKGFAHGFLTLEDNSHMIYHHTEYYKPGFEGGLRFDDPLLKIDLPELPKIISEKDKNNPLITNTFKGIEI